jgi:hypothetical protein
MKNNSKALRFFLAASIAFASSAYAGFYFDVGAEGGRRTTTESYDGCVYDSDDSSWGWACYTTEPQKDKYSGIGTDLGLRIGGGPSKVGYGLFFVADMSTTVLADNFHSYLSFGPGLIFYPIRELQLGSAANFGLIKSHFFYPGYGYNFSVAYDMGEGNNGLLLGIKFSSISGKIDTWNERSNNKLESSMIGAFVKYTFRKKRAETITDE